MNSKLPALESEFSTDVLMENLNTMRKAREAFIHAESSERVKRALRHNIRSSSDNKFFTGDLVLYKRNDCRRWKGPGRVIGSESSNILIKHGSSYVRVHACRVMLDKRAETVGTEIRTEETNEDENDSTDAEHESNAALHKNRHAKDSEESECSSEEESCGENEEVQEENAPDGSEELTETIANAHSTMTDTARLKLKSGMIIDYKKKG